MHATVDANVQGLAQAAESSSGHQQIYAAATAGTALRLGVCQPVLKDFLTSRKPESLAILGIVDQYLSRWVGKSTQVGPNAEVSLVRPPQHGRFYITPADVVGGWPGHWYLGEADYAGKDQFTVRVKVGQQMVDVTIFTSVVVGDSAAVSWCLRSYGSQVWRMANNLQFRSGSALALGAQIGDRPDRDGLPPSVTALRGFRGAPPIPGIGTNGTAGHDHRFHRRSLKATFAELPQRRLPDGAQTDAVAPTPEMVLTADNTSTYRAVISRCQEVDNPVLVPTSALYALDAIGLVKNYMAKRAQSLGARDIVSAAVVTAPLGGRIIAGGSGLDTAFTYRPSAGFRGDDKAAIAVTVNNVRYLVHFTLRVVEVTRDGNCGPRREAGAAPVHVVWDSANPNFGQADLAAWIASAHRSTWVAPLSGFETDRINVPGAASGTRRAGGG